MYSRLSACVMSVAVTSPDKCGTVGMRGQCAAIFDLNPHRQRKGDLSAEHSSVRVRASLLNPLSSSHLQKLFVEEQPNPYCRLHVLLAFSRNAVSCVLTFISLSSLDTCRVSINC